MACSDYDVNVEIVVCITEDGTLQVFWRPGGDGSGSQFKKVINESGWDGSTVKGSITDSQICGEQTDLSSSPTKVSLSAQSLGTDGNGNETVQVNWKLGCGSCAAEGTRKIVVQAGASCPA